MIFQDTQSTNRGPNRPSVKSCMSSDDNVCLLPFQVALPALPALAGLVVPLLDLPPLLYEVVFSQSGAQPEPPGSFKPKSLTAPPTLTCPVLGSMQSD
jgi:hypothetical protein